MRFPLTLIAGLLSLQGCASIVSETRYPVTITSSPPRAEFRVVDRRTEQTIHTGMTPSTVTLKAGAGFFRSADYQVELRKDGYDQNAVMIPARTDGWYFANIILGGLLGMLIVDPATGSMWYLGNPDTVNLGENPDAVYDDTAWLTPALPVETAQQAPAEEPRRKARCTRNPTIQGPGC